MTFPSFSELDAQQIPTPYRLPGNMQVTDSGKIQHSEMQDIAESIKNIHDHGIAAPSPLCMGPSSRSTASGLPPVREISAPADRGAQPMLA